MTKTKLTHTPKNKKLIGQTCDCFFSGAAMLCKLHAAAPDLLAAAKSWLADIQASRPTSRKTEDMLCKSIAKAQGETK